MGASSTNKKHKKDKKHKHRSHSHSSQSGGEEADDVMFDLTLTGEGGGEEGDSSERRHRHHRHKRHKDKEHKERHKHKHHRERRRVEVIAVQGSDSDSSDCVEVPVDDVDVSRSRSDETERELVAPPPPQLSKNADYERERERERREREREREKEKERERQREYELAKEREREKDRERERELARRREREREAEKERAEREKELRARERERERIRDRERERERERRHQHLKERQERAERPDKRRMEARDRERSRSFSPIPENGAGDSLSVEETNKLRAKLGLKPLELDTGPIKPKPSATTSKDPKRPSLKEKELASYKDEWGEFLHKPADNLKEKSEAEKLREKLKQSKEKRFLEERLARIRTLGESDDEVDDVSKWVQRNKHAVDLKKEAAKRAKVLEEMDAEFGVDSLIEEEKEEERRKAYSDKHLKGLRVEHDMNDFSEGKTVVLTLKDNDVLNEEDGDTLVNVNMIDDERYRKNVATKKQNPLNYGYNVYEEQYDEFGHAIERGILEKYDEDVDGNKVKKNFVIGDNLEQQREHQRKLLEIKTKLAGKRLETLADTKLQLVSDTFSETEIAKFKKPKKKVKKLRQKLKADDLLPLGDESMEQHFGSRRARRRELGPDVDEMDADNSMNSDSTGATSKFKLEDDEADLERELSKARKLKQKESIIRKPMVIDIGSIKQEIKVEASEDDATVLRGPDGNIVLNATAEFCRTLGDIPTYGMAGNRDVGSNELMEIEEEDVIDERPAMRPVEQESSHGTWNSVNPDEVMRPAEFDEVAEDMEEVAILYEEPDVGAGVANALRLALSKGYLEKEEHNRPSNSKMAHLQAKNYSIEDKSAGDDDKFGRRDRFHAGPIMDFKDKETFKPNVKLEYIDDNGRILNLKEAFRYLSHKFHGKGPGKNKIEKRLKKMEQDGLMKTMSSTDTPLGTLTMLQQKQKETKTPYVVLSGGKQSAAGSLTAATISKYK